MDLFDVGVIVVDNENGVVVGVAIPLFESGGPRGFKLTHERFGILLGAHQV